MRPLALVLMLIASPACAQSPELNSPGGGGCAGAIARFRAVQENDLAMGHVAKSVYAQIKREIDAAEKVCAAGADAKAAAMVRASEARHGYPSHI